jgi:hypothetical protein
MRFVLADTQRLKRLSCDEGSNPFPRAAVALWCLPAAPEFALLGVHSSDGRLGKWQ